MADNIGIFITEVLAAMQTILSDSELQKLENVLFIKLHGYSLQKEETYDEPVSGEEWEHMFDMFSVTKRVSNRSDGTITAYHRCIEKFMQSVNKPMDKITAMDIRWYLGSYQEKHHSSQGYIDNMRRIFSSFFTWCYLEGLISSNPMARVEKVKVPKKIFEPFTAEERAKLKDACEFQRDIALLEFLYSTALRVGECCSVNIEDINFATRELKVYGSKDKRDRIVYITEECAYQLKKYLDERDDDNPALFVTVRSPHARLAIPSVQQILRALGKKTGIHCHPHKFRRSMLTDGAKRGIPLQELQTYAGHDKPETTMGYVKVHQDNVKASFNKYLG
jgi:site-specific recombinase XerD